MNPLEAAYERCNSYHTTNEIKYLNVCKFSNGKQILLDYYLSKPGGYRNQKYTINLWVWPQTKPFNEKE